MPRCIRFDVFELRPESSELFKGATRVKLKPQAARVLELLVLRAGEAVSREELKRAVWDEDTFVDFDRSLNSCVTQVRAALGDDPLAPRFIETLPRHGYRFIGKLAPEAKAPPRRWPIALAVGFAIAVATAASFWPARPGPAEPLMLLVRPFENLSGDESQDFFAAGLTEELITRAAALAPERLGVYARDTAMRSSSEIACDYALEGSFRRQGERLRITARLVDARDSRTLWTESYDRAAADALDVQSEVAERVARALAPALPRSGPPSYSGSTSVAAAHEAYLKGRHALAEMSASGCARAADAFERAVALDPRYARAWAGLADAWNLKPWWGAASPRESARRGREAAERALAIAPDLAEAEDAMGFVLLYRDFDFAGAEERFRRAIALQPGLASTHYWYAGLLSALGRHDEAIDSIRRAQELDPLSPLINADAGWYYYYARRYPEALRECRRVLERNPEYPWAQYCVVAAAARAGLDEEARRGLMDLAAMLRAPEEVRQRISSTPDADAAGRLLSGWLLARTESRPGEFYPSSYAMALLRLDSGDPTGALESLEAAFDERDGALVQLATDPRLDPLRGEPRFERLLGRVNLRAFAVSSMMLPDSSGSARRP
jgi:TolB-like protein/DNA-binding winged helix-turn-helix (wHTH) protein/Tfp pilus assembly protein PilF